MSSKKTVFIFSFFIVPVIFSLFCTGVATGTDEHVLSHLRQSVPVLLQMPTGEILDPFFVKLQQLETRQGSPRICILQIGDSHTEGDMLSGQLRSNFQGRFGDAGRGMVPAGKVHKYCSPSHLKVGKEGRWDLANALYHDYPAPIGLSGFRISGKDPKGILWVRPDVSRPICKQFSKLWINYLAGPGQGEMAVSIDSQTPIRVATFAPHRKQRRFFLQLKEGNHSVSISPIGTKPIDLFSIIMERDAGGVIVETAGMGGSEFNLLSRLDPELLRQDLIHRDPSLILFAFGTNEAFYKSVPKNYERQVGQAIQNIRQTLPGIPVVLIGPPDANRIPKACRKWAKRNKLKLNDFQCKSKPSPLWENQGKPSRKNCHWFPATGLASIREIQKRLAFENGCAYWEWGALMQGDCGMDSWSRLDTPLASEDRVHMTLKGYRISGRALYNAIIKKYNEFKKRQDK